MAKSTKGMKSGGGSRIGGEGVGSTCTKQKVAGTMHPPKPLPKKG